MGLNYASLYDGKILYFPGIIENPQWILDTVEARTSPAIGDWIPWTAHAQAGAYEYGIMKSVQRGLLEEETEEDREVSEKLINTLDTAIWTGYRFYLEKLGMSAENLEEFDGHYWRNRSPNFAIKLYHPGGDHGPHPDIDGDDPVGITTTLYLNDNYDGGAITFIDAGVAIKPKAGSLVVFPSRAVHISTAISNGQKYFTNEVQVWPRNKLREEAPLWDEESWPS